MHNPEAVAPSPAGAPERDAESQLRGHLQAARAAFPGPGYHDWLRWLHDCLRPHFYCEIGGEAGASLALARPETQAVGIDPAPRISTPLPRRTQVFAMPSDDFFLGGYVDRALGEARFGFGFIDGLHRAAQTLRDFIHLERFSRPDAVIAFHDVLPVCAEVATPDQRTTFWTGDTFKALLALTDVRPDLGVVTIPCFPSGLALVAGVNPQDATDMATYDAALADWQSVAFEAAMPELKRRVTFLPNELGAFARYLVARRPV